MQRCGRSMRRRGDCFRCPGKAVSRQRRHDRMPREECDEEDDPGRARHRDCWNQRQLCGGEAQGRDPATRVLGLDPGSSSARPRASSRTPVSKSRCSTPRAARRRSPPSPPAASTSRMSNGILGAIGAYVKGGEATPYRIISAEMTGANELFWWVKADSPIKSLKDARRGQDHRVLVAGLVVEPDPAHPAQAGRLEGQAGADRRRAWQPTPRP